MYSTAALFLFALQAPGLTILAPYEGLWQSETRAFQLDLRDDGASATLRHAVWQDGAWHWEPAWRIRPNAYGGWPQGRQPGQTRGDPPLELHDDSDPGIEWHIGGDYGADIEVWDAPQDGRFAWESMRVWRNGRRQLGEGVWVRVQP